MSKRNHGKEQIKRLKRYVRQRHPNAMCAQMSGAILVTTEQRGVRSIIGRGDSQLGAWKDARDKIRVVEFAEALIA